MGKLRFYSIASGSSGNCYYIGNSVYGFLFDAGVGPRVIRNRLKEIGMGLEQVRAVFVTHDHYDHIKSVGVLSEKSHLPIYATRKVHKGIEANYGVTQKVAPINQHVVEQEIGITLGEFRITPFPIPHDAQENCGYTIDYEGKRLTLATDIGHPTERLCQAVGETDYLIIEANHDKEMLRNGRYTPHLKQRVAGEQGHLSNVEAAETLKQYASQRLTHVFLCHLSQHNNTPQLAYDTVAGSLPDTVQLSVLKRNEGMLFDL